MPRRKDPVRNIGITLDENAVRDALSLWVRTYHGIDIESKCFEFKIDPETKSFELVIAQKRPGKVTDETDATVFQQRTPTERQSSDSEQ